MHYEKIPQLLDALLISPSVAAAARATGITDRTVWGWLVRSKAGDAPLQAIEWLGITAPFDQHFHNSKILAAQEIEQGVLDRAAETRRYGADCCGMIEQKPDYAVWI